MRKIIVKVILIILVVFLSFYLYRYDPFYLNSSDSIVNIRIFKDEEFWPLAIAVDKGDIKKIKYHSEMNPSWVNKTGSRFGINLLYFAITTEKYESAEALLKAGADPNIRMMKLGGQTALYDASCFSSVDSNAKKDPKFLKLLLKYGADPNLYYLGGEDLFSNSTEIGDSPLIHSVGCGIEKTKVLIDSGADVNHKTITGRDLLFTLLSNSDLDGLDIMSLTLSLIQNKNLNLNSCVDYKISKTCSVALLRELLFSLDSEKYSIKMKIVSEFSKQGIDYWSVPIPERRLEQIKKLYPNTWQEYITKY